MKYFIEHVTTYATTGKARKGALLQAAVGRLEHTVIADDDALQELVSQLRRLCEACNSTLRGKPVKIEHTREYRRDRRGSGQITAQADYTGSEAYFFSIGYAPMGDTLFSSGMRHMVWDTVLNLDREVFDAAWKGGAE